METIKSKAVRRFKSKTPFFAKVLQLLMLAITFAPTYYSSLPEEWKASIPANVTMWTSLAGFLLAVGLQFTTKKQK